MNKAAVMQPSSPQLQQEEQSGVPMLVGIPGISSPSCTGQAVGHPVAQRVGAIYSPFLAVTTRTQCPTKPEERWHQL